MEEAMTEIEAYTRLAQDLEQMANLEAVVCQGQVDGGIMAVSMILAIVFCTFMGYAIGRAGE